jgi:hypothetical protein
MHVSSPGFRNAKLLSLMGVGFMCLVASAVERTEIPDKDTFRTRHMSSGSQDVPAIDYWF